ncbi:MAG TPA: 1,4-alpha-glucan branching enzyme, partial [Xanthomonadales bacterium]|nr:1,4-alpha-glucan branching enzyme [Xanthomonadales bacterium]
DWGTLIYNYGRREVANFLVANALHWLREFHVDGLRVDAVASMLYRDYSRKHGEWTPNVHGGRENLEAVAFLRSLNDEVRAQVPHALMIAEESTAWPAVTGATADGGLGFHYKWNMGWMNDTLRYFHHDPAHRALQHDKLTFGQTYAYSERFLLPLSHDEVVHGKGSLLTKMPGDRWQQLANLRLLLAWQYLQPGKKLLFMGCELGQEREWNHDGELDWHLLEREPHRGVQRLVADLNRLYRERRALHEGDCAQYGYRWIDCDDAAQSVLAWQRLDRDGAPLVVVCNFTPAVRGDYRIGVPRAGIWREVLNTDSGIYGGSDVGNLGNVVAEQAPWHGEPCSVVLTLPPLAALVLEPGP